MRFSPAGGAAVRVTDDLHLNLKWSALSKCLPKMFYEIMTIQIQIMGWVEKRQAELAYLHAFGYVDRTAVVHLATCTSSLSQLDGSKLATYAIMFTKYKILFNLEEAKTLSVRYGIFYDY